MASSIKKAIIPVAGLGTRFLPLSKVLPKEFFPLIDKPAIQYIIDEAKNSGIKEIIFVNRPEKNEIERYFTQYAASSPKLEEILKNRGKNELLQELANLENDVKKISFSFVSQQAQLGDGHAILQAKQASNNEPCLVLFGDDIVDSKIPCSQQLIKVFNKYQKPVIALSRLPKEKLPSYGVVKVKKVGPRLYKIEGIEEKPALGQAPSDLAIVGKYIIDSQVFDFLENTPSLAHGEIRLAGAFEEMIKKGLTIYGYEFKGRWLECGNKISYLKSNIYLSLKDPRFKKELKKFIREEI
ncbi:MAG: UTP--glucose-1-phosphate uridylyltransferase [Candidatus Nealsonbacteria bacterium]